MVEGVQVLCWFVDFRVDDGVGEELFYLMILGVVFFFVQYVCFIGVEEYIEIVCWGVEWFLDDFVYGCMMGVGFYVGCVGFVLVLFEVVELIGDECYCGVVFDFVVDFVQMVEFGEDVLGCLIVIWSDIIDIILGIVGMGFFLFEVYWCFGSLQVVELVLGVVCWLQEQVVEVEIDGEVWFKWCVVVDVEWFYFNFFYGMVGVVYFLV